MPAKIIPDRNSAERLGASLVARGGGSFSIFEYQQPRSGLTLFGVALRRDGVESEIRFQ